MWGGKGRNEGKKWTEWVPTGRRSLLWGTREEVSSFKKNADKGGKKTVRCVKI